MFPEIKRAKKVANFKIDRIQRMTSITLFNIRYLSPIAP